MLKQKSLGSYGAASGLRSQWRNGSRLRRALWLLALLAAFAVTGGVRAQQAPQTPPLPQPAQPSTASQAGPPAKIAVDVKVVNVLATVRDKHGKIVSELGKDDFVLTEDGKP